MGSISLGEGQIADEKTEDRKEIQSSQRRKIVISREPGKYAGWKPGKVFGRLDCKSGMRMKKENRVFFLTVQDALEAGYRPCLKCKPLQREFNILTA